MFANESYSDRQDERYDVLIQPGGLWLRVCGDKKAVKALFGRKRGEPQEYFAALRSAAEENGYRQNPDVNMEIEYHCHAEYSTPPHTYYVYIPVCRV